MFFKPPSHHHLHLNLSSNLSKTETFLPLFPQMGRHHRRLPLLDLPRHQGRAASHDRKGLGPRHQHGIDARSGRVAVQVGVRFFFPSSIFTLSLTRNALFEPSTVTCGERRKRA